MKIYTVNEFNIVDNSDAIHFTHKFSNVSINYACIDEKWYGSCSVSMPNRGCHFVVSPTKESFKTKEFVIDYYKLDAINVIKMYIKTMVYDKEKAIANNLIKQLTAKNNIGSQLEFEFKTSRCSG